MSRATLSYEHLISLIPSELGRNAAVKRRRSQSQFPITLSNIVEGEGRDPRFDAIMQSHLSELQRQMKNSLSSLEGFTVPNTR